MRALLIVALATVACTSPAPAIPTPTPTPERGVLTITALLDLSGPHASVGAQQRNALQLWVDQQPSPRTVPVKLRTVDVAGSDAKLLIELRRAAVDDPADAVIMGAPVTYDDTLGRAIGVAALPVLFALPLASDPAPRPGGRWTFALAPTLASLASLEIDDATRRGVLVPSLVLADQRGRIDPLANALGEELRRRRLEPLTTIAVQADGTIPPVMRSSLSVLRSVHCTVLASTCASVAEMARSSGAPTLLYLSYLTTPADLSDHRELAARAMLPGTRTILPVFGFASGIDLARQQFVRSYVERNGAVGSQAAAAYDAMSLLAAAADRAGADDRAALRDALERITMPLIASTYSFAPDRHVGPDPEDLGYLRWNGSALAAAPGPGIPLR